MSAKAGISVLNLVGQLRVAALPFRLLERTLDGRSLGDLGHVSIAHLLEEERRL